MCDKDHDDDDVKIIGVTQILGTSYCQVEVFAGCQLRDHLSILRDYLAVFNGHVDYLLRMGTHCMTQQ
jgi:hypothetical protein